MWNNIAGAWIPTTYVRSGSSIGSFSTKSKHEQENPIWRRQQAFPARQWSGDSWKHILSVRWYTPLLKFHLHLHLLLLAYILFTCTLFAQDLRPILVRPSWRTPSDFGLLCAYSHVLGTELWLLYIFSSVHCSRALCPSSLDCEWGNQTFSVSHLAFHARAMQHDFTTVHNVVCTFDIVRVVTFDVNSYLPFWVSDPSFIFKK